MKFIASLIILSACFCSPSSADELDDAIADLQSSRVKYIGEKRWKELHAKSVEEDFVKYQQATASFYSAQVKWAIIKPKTHGGYPYRTNLFLSASTRSAIYKVLSKDYQKDPTPLKAYTLMCPAILAGNHELVSKLEKDIAADKFLASRLKKNLANWKNYLKELREKK